MCDQNRTTAEGETNSMKKAPSKLRDMGIEGESSFYRPSRTNSGPCAQSGARAADSIIERTPRRFVDIRSATSCAAVRTNSLRACRVRGRSSEPARPTRRLSSEIRSARSRGRPAGAARAALARGETLGLLAFPAFLAMDFIAFSLPHTNGNGRAAPRDREFLDAVGGQEGSGSSGPGPSSHLSQPGQWDIPLALGVCRGAERAVATRKKTDSALFLL